MTLTPRQLEIVKFIRAYAAERGYAPTMQEIADHFGVSKPTIFEHIEALQARGALRREANRRRTIELAPAFASEPRRVRFRGARLPLVGRIAAGQPIEAVEESEDLDIEALFRGRTGDVFALQVRGNSMIDEQIRDGDYVIVEKRDNARNGETVVALIDDAEATLKKFYHDVGQVRLQPANPRMEPMFVEPERVRIQGVVIGVLRKY
ncbi:MAG: transcriptional repressor LexA [Planctomycetes bacterium]|nr:transcriptional repressor LexA [Planctomycetota bacterium]